jgi:RNA methyltransferase, TrmH family
LDTISIGKHNPRLADIRKAVQHGSLTADGLLPVEGPKLVREAYSSGMTIAALFIREGVAPQELPPASTLYTVERGPFKEIQATDHSQGVIALVQPRSWSLSDVLVNSPAPIVVLAGLQDPGNVGTILRVAESFGAPGCLGLSGTVAIHNSKVLRASAGSVFRLPLVWDLHWEAVVEALRARKIPLVGTSPHAVESITAWDWGRPAAILVGNEGSGLSSTHSAACAALLRIPHEPQTESLNSAIATALILYEAYRRRSRS